MGSTDRQRRDPRPTTAPSAREDLRTLGGRSTWDGEVLKAAGPFIFTLALDQGPSLTSCSLHSTAQGCSFIHLYSPKHPAQQGLLSAFLRGHTVEGKRGRKNYFTPPAPSHVLKPER